MQNEVVGEKHNQVPSIIDIPIPDSETKKGNYLSLNRDEVEAIKSYTGFGSVWMNALFTTDIKDVLQRLEHWAGSDENVEQRFNITIIDTIVHLYSSLLKAHKFHQSPDDFQEHRAKLYRGSTGTNHSNGFKSFTTKRAMAESFGKSVFEIRFPQAIPFLSHYDIYNYAPHTSRREEEEYLFSPFCEIKTDSTHLLSAKRKKDEVLVLREIKSSQDTVPVDIDSNLRLMAKLILSYKQILRNLEDFQRWNDHDSENYRTTLNQKKKVKESYKILSEQVLNYIEQQCALLHEKEL